MSRPHPRFLLGIALATLTAGAAAQLQAGPSARKALETFVQSVPREVSSQIVAVMGFDGSQEPDIWHFLVRSTTASSGIVEYRVADGLLLGPRPLSPEEAPEGLDRPLPLQSWTVDSHDVARIIDDAIILEGVRFARLDYQLCWREKGPEPLWMATLVGQRGETLGHVFVSSQSGAVTHRAFYHDFPRLPGSASPKIASSSTPVDGKPLPTSGQAASPGTPSGMVSASGPAAAVPRKRVGLSLIRTGSSSTASPPPVPEVEVSAPGTPARTSREKPPFFKRR